MFFGERTIWPVDSLREIHALLQGQLASPLPVRRAGSVDGRMSSVFNAPESENLTGDRSGRAVLRSWPDGTP
jgi:hypothetical protein